MFSTILLDVNGCKILVQTRLFIQSLVHRKPADVDRLVTASICQYIFLIAYDRLVVGPGKYRSKKSHYMIIIDIN